MNRALKVGQQIPGPPLHSSLGLPPQALDFLAPVVVLDAWFPSWFCHFLLLCSVSHFQSFRLLCPQGFSPFSLFLPCVHWPLSATVTIPTSYPSPSQCLGPAAAFSLGYSPSHTQGSPGIIVKPISGLPGISCSFELRLWKGGLSQRYRNLGQVTGCIFIL